MNCVGVDAASTGRSVAETIQLEADAVPTVASAVAVVVDVVVVPSVAATVAAGPAPLHLAAEPHVRALGARWALRVLPRAPWR